jgi:hypothetical protein
MPLSEFGKDYDWVNELLRKHLLDEIDINPEEESRLNTFLDKFVKTDCDYNEGCRSDTCRFCGTPDKLLKLLGLLNHWIMPLKILPELPIHEKAAGHQK